MSDDRFTELLAELRVEAEVAIVRERRSIAPDFAAVVAAARARDPLAISEAAVHEAGEFAPIVELGAEFERRGGEAERANAVFDAWIADARELVEADVAARRLAGVPPLPQPAASLPEAAGRRWWLPAIAVAAVLAGLAVAVPRLFDAFVDGNYKEATKPNEAEYVTPDPSERESLRLLPEPAANEPVVHQAIPRGIADPKPAPTRTDAARERARDRIARLDAEAQAAWAQGDLEGAERRFREIIEVASTSQRRYADLAYGDLFTLARQRKQAAAERALWQEYLERFPSGRYADDARAGLCRRGPLTERETCWQTYLAEFPQGVHARAARRALGLEPESP